MLKYLSPVRFVEKRSNLKFSELQKDDFIQLIDSSFDYRNVVTVDEISYTKEDLLILLETAPEYTEFIRCNELVWQSEDFLYLLEDKKLHSSVSLRRVDKVLSSNDFPEYLKEYIIDSCREVLAVDFEKYDFYDLALLIEFIDKYHLDLDLNFSGQINNFLDDSISFYSSLSLNNYEEKRSELVPWTNSQWNRFLTILPNDFREKRSELSRQILRFINVVMKEDLELGKDLYKYLCQVKGVEADVVTGMEHLNNLLKKISAAEEYVERESSPIRVALSVLLFAFALFKLFRACSDF